MTVSRLLLLAALTLPSVAAAPVTEVDPFIGTGGHGHTFPGATLPFGMVQLGPDTRVEGWDGCSGYHFSDSALYGFSHTHLSGTGISDYGDILFRPVTDGSDLARGRASRFDKASERAEPGSYAVRLSDDGIDVELTATERTGTHRYRYPQDRPARVIVDLAHRDRVLESWLRPVGDREIEGLRRSTGWARDQVIHFVARFSRPWKRVEIDEGPGVVGRFDFGSAGGDLIVRVGISAVDVEGARRNLDAEQGDRPFDDLRRAARARWAEALGRVEIEGGSEAEHRIFYTALYHTMIAPNLYSDVDGRYLGMDREIHRAAGRRHYTVFSLWDTFRSVHPLFTLLETERTREFVETFLAMYEQGGRLPVWELAANETDTMIGYHAVPVIADAWVKAIRGFDVERALAAMVDSARRDHFGLAAYRRQGFIGAEDDGESVSKTLEYAYDDWCIARMAEGLGHGDLAREFGRRARSWRHLFDPETGFFRAKRNQAWIAPFDPRRVDNHYTEANAWQYAFFAPHDVAGLIEAHGGDERFVARLDALFDAETETTGREQPDITGRIGQYAHGNEPSHHVAWLYHFAGRPGESALRVRRILDELYTAEPDGLCGNDDVGQMSAWYVLAAIGLFPVTPGSDEYLIGVPLFDRVTLRLDGGRRFVVRTRGRPAAGPAFVETATLDGQPLTRSFLRHAEIARGGELVLGLGPRPGETWGRAREDRPRPWPAPPFVAAAPYLRAESDRFRERLAIELASPDPGAEIRYGDDLPYEGPIEIRESTRLRFEAEARGDRSPVVEAYLHRIPNDWSVELASPPNPQYTAGGPLALVDGLHGTVNWRTGGWLGFQDAEFVATVDLKERRPVRRLGASFLQDQPSWIWMPAELVLAVSDDGIAFREVARLGTDLPADAEGVLLREMVAELAAAAEVRYVRFAARSFGTIPAWHPGRGERAFVFVDEVIVE